MILLWLQKLFQDVSICGFYPLQKKHLAKDLTHKQTQNTLVGYLVILFFCLHNVETKLLVELNSRLIIDLDVEEDG